MAGAATSTGTRSGLWPAARWGQPLRPSVASAFLAGGLWLLVAVLCFVLAGLNSADGIRQTPEAAVALLGPAFGRGFIANGDPAIVATYVAGGVVLLLAALVIARLGFARWILAGLGFLVCAYYVFAVVRLTIDHGGTLIIVPSIALMLWLAASMVSVLPPVGRAMR
ncbi:hypothetical protein SK571_25140 [Lentzea sp. BCCO 10_0798]|uniref:Uncharacterized protein n=1 Tax=Lentzea kristufekii TaxID=3095430 RepID=A0ABU4TWJ9_9PSEU|nr:hypothetical protein [Lentzea sp. BCCO 10_0798]MDX8052683.1 hypothetical protein [Lentzea sp. BCCO 10_0798]